MGEWLTFLLFISLLYALFLRNYLSTSIFLQNSTAIFDIKISKPMKPINFLFRVITENVQIPLTKLILLASRISIDSYRQYMNININ